MPVDLRSQDAWPSATAKVEGSPLMTSKRPSSEATVPGRMADSVPPARADRSGAGSTSVIHGLVKSSPSSPSGPTNESSQSTTSTGSNTFMVNGERCSGMFSGRSPDASPVADVLILCLLKSDQSDQSDRYVNHPVRTSFSTSDGVELSWLDSGEGPTLLMLPG